MMKPLIGITTGEIINALHPWSPITYGQSHTYSDVIIRAGGVPVLIPITDQVSALKEIYKRLDGILFAGGNDINPGLYGEEVRLAVDISVARDTAEVALMEWSLKDQKPILGICRGMHLLNVVGGGTLYQDIRTDNPEANNHEQSSQEQNIEFVAHKLRVDARSKFAQTIAAHELGANSHHHQAIKQLAANLNAVAWAEDGMIEAVEGTGQEYVTAVQCHPESLHEVVPAWDKLFSSFVKASGNVHTNK
jgi:putative glutamine amidotransferase